MTIATHIETFDGKPVRHFGDGPLPEDPSAVAWRIQASEFDAPPDDLEEQLDDLLSQVGDQVQALVIGEWGSSYEAGFPTELLTSRAARLPRLRALFVGEMTVDECEMSWIQHEDVTPLLEAFGALEVFRVRGATEGLTLRPFQHGALREFAIEAGGLPRGLVAALDASKLPALEHLELWIGTDEYGRDTTVADLAATLSGEAYPGLRYLGLSNAEIADEIAAAVATAPVVPRLEVLDLSKGTLSDAGAEALLSGQSLTHLRRLDLHHHYLSEGMAARLVAALPDTEVDLSDEQQGDEDEGETYRYVAVGE